MEYPIYEEYPALYRDARGEEAAIIRNDGASLRMTVRGVEFVGGSPDEFEPAEETLPTDRELFTIDRAGSCNFLSGFEIAYDAPLPIMAQDQPAKAILHVRLGVGTIENCKGYFDLRLSYNGRNYVSSGVEKWRVV